MIKQLKIGFQVMRYAYAVPSSIAFMIVIHLVGIALFIGNPPTNGMGVCFMALGALFPQQLIYSLAASNMVGSSGWKRRMETSIPVLTGFAVELLDYLIVLAASGLYLVSHPEDGADMALVVLTCGGLMAAVMIYGGMAYKFFIVSTIVFFVVVWGASMLLRLAQYEVIELGISFGGAVAISFALLIVGALAQYGISLLVYRVPLSKLAQMRGLRKWM